MTGMWGGRTETCVNLPLQRLCCCSGLCTVASLRCSCPVKPLSTTKGAVLKAPGGTRGCVCADCTSRARLQPRMRSVMVGPCAGGAVQGWQVRRCARGVVGR